MMIPLKAYAKLNLSLNVLKRLADGYHELDTLLIRLRLHDRLLFSPSPTLEVIYTNIPTPHNDIVSRTIEGYAKLSGGHCLAHVEVEKRIPMEAGLAGGSADAAAVLLAMQQVYGALDETELAALALSLGADVPYCTQIGPYRARGKGEALTRIKAPPIPLWFLLVKPERGISTRELFSSLDVGALSHPDIDAALAAWLRGDIRAFGHSLGNSLEAPAISILPEIGDIISALREQAPIACQMTGSGSTIFGLFETEQSAAKAAEHFKNCAFVSLTRSL